MAVRALGAMMSPNGVMRALSYARRMKTILILLM